MEKRLVSFRLPENLITELKSKAEADDVSVTELICRYSQQGLQKSSGESCPPTDIDLEIRLARLEERVEHLKKLENKFDSFLERFLSGDFVSGLRRQFLIKP